MGINFIIRVRTKAESLEESARWDCEDAVKETLKEIGIESEASSYEE